MKLRRVASRLFRKRHPPVGAQPGTLIFPTDAPPPRIHVMRYAPGELEEHDVEDANTLRGFIRDDAVTWIDVQGLGDEATMRTIASLFNIHVLALEDIVNTPQRPKVEVFDDHVFIVTRMVRVDDASRVEREQVSLIIGSNHVLTFQEHHGDVFDPVRARLRQGGPIFRSSGAEYLAYALLDAIVDGYYPVLESFGERIEAIEQEISGGPGPSVLGDIHGIKRELLAVRRAMWPQREVISTLLRHEIPLISAKVDVHLRDCHDHCVQIIDMIETYRELTGGLMDMHLASVANRQNEVMKTLTIMASIFIPLSFMAGVYGMNFERMPELHFRYGYPVLLSAMGAVAVTMLVYFYRKGWMGRGK